MERHQTEALMWQPKLEITYTLLRGNWFENCVVPTERDTMGQLHNSTHFMR